MTLQLWNASVIDSRNPRALERMCITLRDGTIEQVAAMQGAAPDGAVDLGGRFVIPGLIDAHIHLADDPKMLGDAALPKARQGEEPRPRELVYFALANAARAFLRAGSRRSARSAAMTTTRSFSGKRSAWA